jgi:hypothetical protein
MTSMTLGPARSIREPADDWQSLIAEQLACEPLPGAPALPGVPARLTADANELALFRTRRELGRRYLPFLKTLTDFDIASEVGYHELTGPPLTVKQLILLDLAPSMTVFRRLERLCNLGVVARTRSASDGRVNELRLTPAVHQLFAAFATQTAYLPQHA